MQKQIPDDGGFPRFTSYHDYRLTEDMIGPTRTDHAQFKAAFNDFANAIRNNPRWQEHFNPTQIRQIEVALSTNGPKIPGFVWHHHQDHGLLQLVSESEHRKTWHYGGRFITGGRGR